MKIPMALGHEVHVAVGDTVEVTIKVKAKIKQLSDAHGQALLLQFEERDYVEAAFSRRVWVDQGEIVNILKVK